MIDPVGSIPLSRLTTSPKVSSINTKKESEKVNQSSPSKEILTKSKSDLVSLSFNLNGDLESLRESVTVVFDQVKMQLQEYYGLRGQEGEEENDLSEYLPPEDASAQELLDFFSPKNTANRILDFTTGFFDLYAQNHQDESGEDKINGFSTLIGDAIQKGFEEAEKILGDFEELGPIGEKIEETYQMVLKGLNEFRQEHLNDLELQPEKPESLLIEPVSEELPEKNTLE